MNVSDHNAESIKNNPWSIKDIDPDTTDYYHFCMIAVKENWLVLQNVRPQQNVVPSTVSYNVICLTAIRENGLALRYVDPKYLVDNDYTDDGNDSTLCYTDLCEIAVTQNGWALKYVMWDFVDPDNRAEAYNNICLSAIRQCGMSIIYVANKTPKMIRTAIYENSILKDFLIDNTPKVWISDVTPNMLKYKNYLREKSSIDDYHTFCMEAVTDNGLTLQVLDIHDYSRKSEICMAAVRQDCRALKFVNDLYEEIPETYQDMCLLAVMSNGLMLQYVKNQTPSICMAAVINSEFSLQYVDTTEMTSDVYHRICMKAISINGYMIKYVDRYLMTHDRYYELCLVAINQQPLAIYFVHKQSLGRHYNELCLRAATINGLSLMFMDTSSGVINTTHSTHSTDVPSIEVTYNDICIAALKNYGYALKYVYDQTPEMCKIALRENLNSFCYVHEQTEDLCLMLATKFGKLSGIKKQTYKICLAAVKADGLSLRYIDLDKDHYYDLCLAAVHQNGLALQYVDQRYIDNYYDICVAAVNQTGDALQYVGSQWQQSLGTQSNGSCDVIIPDNITAKMYIKLCSDAVANISSSIRYIDVLHLTRNVEEQTDINNAYFDLCIQAVSDDGVNLQNVFVPQNVVTSQLLTPELYKKICLAAVRENGLVLSLVHDKTPDICLAAVRQQAMAIKFIPKESDNQLFNRSASMYLLAVEQNGLLLQYVEIPTSGCTELYEEICIAAVKQNGSALMYVFPQYLESVSVYTKICLIAVRQNGFALQYVDTKYVDTKVDTKYVDNYITICKTAVTQNGLSLPYVKLSEIDANHEIDLYHDICISAVTQNGLSIQYVNLQAVIDMSPENYYILCKAAVTQNGSAIAYIKDKTPDLCKIALSSAGLELKRVSMDTLNLSKEQFNDIYYDLCLTAVTNNGEALRLVSTSFEFTKEQLYVLSLTAVTQTAKALYYVKPHTKNYNDICLVAVKQSAYMLGNVHPQISHTETTYYDICLAAVKLNGESLRYVDAQFLISQYEEEVSRDKYHEVCLAAVKQHGTVLAHCIYQTDDICIAAVTQSGAALKYVNDLAISPESYHAICMLAVKHNGIFLQYVLPTSGYPEICMAAVVSNGLAIKYLIRDHVKDFDKIYEIYEAAVKSNPRCMKYIELCQSTTNYISWYIELCKLAISLNGATLKSVNLHTPGLTSDIYNSMCLSAVSNYGLALSFVDRQTFGMTNETYKDICLAAVTENGRALQYVESNYGMTSETYNAISLAAIRDDGTALQYYIVDPNNLNMYNTICMEAVTKDGESIQYVQQQYTHQSDASSIPSYELICLAAVRQNGMALQYIKNQTVDMCIVAINNDTNAITHCKALTYQTKLDLIRTNIFLARAMKIMIPDDLVDELTTTQECCVCYTNFGMLTPCRHPVCNDCFMKLDPVKCPMCRRT